MPHHPHLTSDPIFIFDFHDTIAKEGKDYYLALEEGIEKVYKELSTLALASAKIASNCSNSEFPSIEQFKDGMYNAIRTIHSETQDDWNPDIFSTTKNSYIHSLLEKYRLDEEKYTPIEKDAIALRKTVAAEYTEAFPTIVELVKTRHGYIATDSTTNGILPSLQHLFTADEISGVFCCHSTPHESTNSLRDAFAGKLHEMAPGWAKPHPRMVGMILADWVRTAADCPKRLRVKSTEAIYTMAFREIRMSEDMPAWLCTQLLVIKDGPYAALFHRLLENTIIVGNSSLRDTGLAYFSKQLEGSSPRMILTSHASPENAHPEQKNERMLIGEKIENITGWHQSQQEDGAEVDRWKLGKFSHSANRIKTSISYRVSTQEELHNAITEILAKKIQLSR